ncbi:hypothetical protein M885DRAFT_549535 [Pelagophyceae sp. CCMP2097]|nr:hypothetical protein M885DRAFT_549535 [Pelagophyceae sp. CCMP2097]
MAGCMVAAGNSYLVVQRTGIFTEMGSATLLMQQSTKPQISVFERSIISVCERVMAVSVFVLLLVFAFEFWRGEELVFILTTCLSILIAAVPVALPVVMNVTLAIGASEMAKQEAIVTHLTAMQEIASMTMLCSDKTGTLTTAKINVFYDHIWTAPGFDRTQVLEWAAISSNPHAADDCIDVAILRSFRDAFPDDFDKRIKAYNVTKFVGFAPEVKRTVAYATHSEQGEVKAAKGLLDKVLSTGNDGGDSWECVNAEDVRHEVERVDLQMSTAGYKTLGVAVGSPDGSGGWVMKFAGVVPMLDPPRGDTKWVIEQIYACGISVKMVTGDHQNIAKETARLVGLGDGILHRDALALRDGDDRDSIIRNADGFAQVMPKDKNDVVRVLQSLNYVVGMTGDGVNDAPALKQAHIGIAVEGATDAARNAADIILTTEGLAPIFTAVLESRKIFQRVYSYVLYRISATVQIVSLLSLLIFVSEQTIKPLYVILLALLNDVTMITISYDNVVPSRSPEQPTIARLLRISCVFGALMTVASLIFYYAGPHIFLSPSFRGDRDAYTQSCIYLQISLGIEALIFITRVPEAPFYSSVPVSSLLFSVLGANLLVTALVVSGTLGPPLKWSDVGATWAYDALWFLLVDLVKVPLTLSLEKCFPPPPNAIGVRTAESTAGFAGQQPRSWSIGAFDIGYTALADASAAIGGNAAACCAHRGADAAPTRAVGVSAEAAVKVDAV